MRRGESLWGRKMDLRCVRGTDNNCFLNIGREGVSDKKVSRSKRFTILGYQFLVSKGSLSKNIALVFPMKKTNSFTSLHDCR